MAGLGTLGKLGVFLSSYLGTPEQQRAASLSAMDREDRRSREEAARTESEERLKIERERLDEQRKSREPVAWTDAQGNVHKIPPGAVGTVMAESMRQAGEQVTPLQLIGLKGVLDYTDDPQKREFPDMEAAAERAKWAQPPAPGVGYTPEQIKRVIQPETITGASIAARDQTFPRQLFEKALTERTATMKAEDERRRAAEKEKKATDEKAKQSQADAYYRTTLSEFQTTNPTLPFHVIDAMATKSTIEKYGVTPNFSVALKPEKPTVEKETDRDKAARLGAKVRAGQKLEGDDAVWYETWTQEKEKDPISEEIKRTRLRIMQQTEQSKKDASDLMDQILQGKPINLDQATKIAQRLRGDVAQFSRMYSDEYDDVEKARLKPLLDDSLAMYKVLSDAIQKRMGTGPKQGRAATRAELYEAYQIKKKGGQAAYEAFLKQKNIDIALPMVD